MRRHPRPPIGPPRLGPPGPGQLRNRRGPPPPHVGPRGPGHGIPPLHSIVPPPHISGAVSVSSCTNSNDPASMDSRLFVGNLNTVALSKEAVEAIFSRYGMVCGISLHKGFAFVQFRHSDDARWAGASEDGKVYAGQALDINIVSQPKNRSALKRSNTVKGLNDSPSKKSRQESSGTNQSLQRTLVTLSSENVENTEKKIAPVATTTTTFKKTAAKSKAKPPTPLIKSNRTVYDSQSSVTPSTPTSNGSPPPIPMAAKESVSADVLICGVCKLQLSSLHSLAQHKKIPCRLRFTCQCNAASGDSHQEPTLFQCATCDSEFVTAWALCQHCTQEHRMSIFKTDTTKENENDEVKQELKIDL